MKSLKQIVRGIWKRVKELGRKAQAYLSGVVMTVVALVVLVVISTFIAFNVEKVITNIGGFNESAWYDIYTNFVSTAQAIFPLIAIACIVMVCMFMLGYILRMITGGRD